MLKLQKRIQHTKLPKACQYKKRKTILAKISNKRREDGSIPGKTNVLNWDFFLDSLNSKESKNLFLKSKLTVNCPLIVFRTKWSKTSRLPSSFSKRNQECQIPSQNATKKSKTSWGFNTWLIHVFIQPWNKLPGFINYNNELWTETSCSWLAQLIIYTNAPSKMGNED